MGRKGRGLGEKLWEEKGGGVEEGGGAETDRKTDRDTRRQRQGHTFVVEEEGGG